ncbi:MAG: ABC transporter ATP-binding protein [Lachnospiraceae bacterium]|nr:ABC transporter ATP-binding protein [Lachnospiraceae bacterium]
MLEVTNLNKTYNTYNSNVHALSNIILTVKKCEFVVVMGESGCGKSTLLNIIAGLLAPTDGTIVYNGDIITGRKKSDLQEYRCRHVGIILQNFSLLNDRTVRQNVELPLRIRKTDKKQRGTLVEKYLEKVGMLDKIDVFPNQLSGGQKQRVAIARALISNPDIILADEPTGALDKANAEQIVKMLREIADSGKMVIMVTHNMDVIKMCDRCITLSDGKMI